MVTKHVIGLISDTHIPEARTQLWPQVAEAFAGVGLILHAGDLHVPDVLDWLERIAPVRAVRGNGDWKVKDPRVEETLILEIGGYMLGMVHGLYYPGPPLATTMERVFGQRVDILVHGDTHVEGIEEAEGVLLVNPGSPTYPHNLDTQLGTVALLEIGAGGPSARIIQL
jgi:putative phosphoesterase